MDVKNIALLSFFLIFRIAVCLVRGPSHLESDEGKHAAFQWNATNRIVQVSYGLYDPVGKDVSPVFVTVNVLAGVTYVNLTNTAAARYSGRVKYDGNLTLGHAWFILKNLTQDDFEKVYVAKIRELGDTSGTYYTVNLTLEATTAAPSTTSSTSTRIITREPATVPTTGPPIPEECLSTGEIVGIIIGVLVGVGIIAVIGVVIYKKVKKDDKCLSLAVLVGIIIGVLVVVGIIVAVIVVIYKKNNDGCIKAGLLVGIIFGVLVPVAVIAAIVVVVYKKKKNG